MRSVDPRGPSHRLTFDEAVEIWLSVWRGEYKNRIAARFDCNVWRVYEVLQGNLHPDSKATAEQKRHDGQLGNPPQLPSASQPSLPF
jgi:hypothetical protein